MCGDVKYRCGGPPGHPGGLPEPFWDLAKQYLWTPFYSHLQCLILICQVPVLFAYTCAFVHPTFFPPRPGQTCGWYSPEAGGYKRRRRTTGKRRASAAGTNLLNSGLGGPTPRTSSFVIIRPNPDSDEPWWCAKVKSDKFKDEEDGMWKCWVRWYQASGKTKKGRDVYKPYFLEKRRNNEGQYAAKGFGSRLSFWRP
jgi:hypothetical protein